jgi:hypothetical protein
MAAPTNTHLQAATVGIREDLEDMIYRVAAEETPFSNNIGKQKIKGTYHEHQVEDLATPDATNAQLEGDDVATLDAAHVTERVSMRPQIFRKTGGVSRTNQKSDRAGREDTLDEQKMIKGIELRRDCEARVIGNYASNAESGSTPRRTGGALAWIESHDSLGATGTSGGYSSGDVAAASNGTQRTFAESQVKAVLATAFSNGARMSQAYMSGTHKQEFSAFSGIADIRKSVGGDKQATIIGAADVYVSDFGNITLIPHPYGLTRDCLLIDPSGWAIGTYDGVKTEPLAKTGDSDKFIMTAEKGLICKNEKKGAAIRDLT